MHNEGLGIKNSIRIIVLGGMMLALVGLFAPTLHAERTRNSRNYRSESRYERNAASQSRTTSQTSKSTQQPTPASTSRVAAQLVAPAPVKATPAPSKPTPVVAQSTTRSTTPAASVPAAVQSPPAPPSTTRPVTESALAQTVYPKHSLTSQQGELVNSIGMISVLLGTGILISGAAFSLKPSRRAYAQPTRYPVYQ